MTPDIDLRGPRPGEAWDAGRFRKPAFVLLLTLIFLALTLPIFTNIVDRDAARAVRGTVDLSRSDLSAAPVMLSGEWRIMGQGALSGSAPIAVPGGWEGERLDSGATLPALAAVSYLLTIKGLPPGQYRLYQGPMYAGSRISVNGRVRSEAGRFGLDAATSVYSTRAQDVVFDTQGGDVSLQIDMSTFHDIGNGLDSAPILGRAAIMQKWFALAWAKELFTDAAAAIIGLFAMIVFMHRREDRAALYVSLGSFTILIALLIFGFDNLVLIIAPGISHSWIYGLLAFQVFVGMIFWLAYVTELFPADALRRAAYWLMLIVAVSLVVQIGSFAIGGNLLASKVNRIFPLLFVATVGMNTVVAVRAALNRRPGSAYFLIGHLAMIGGMLLQVGTAFQAVDTGLLQAFDLAGFGFLVYTFTHLMVLGERWAKAISSAETLLAEVEAARSYNESILQSMSTGVVTIDMESRRARLNTAATRILGVSDEQAAATDAIRFVRATNPVLLDDLEAARERGERRSLLDHDLVTSGGETISANISVVPLRKDDTTTGVLLMIDDISSNKRLEGAMRRFMTQEVMDQVLAQKDALMFGHACNASILFADIRNFTSLAERLSPRDTVDMLNEIFSELFEAVADAEGVLDKYIGDAVMAVFGAPLSTGRDAQNAVAAALRMQEMIAAINARRGGNSELRLGIGIASGEVIAGTIGSPKRMDYTVIGDRVNLASRLQDATKTYGCDIMVCERTAAAIDGFAKVREIDTIRVKGREAEERVFAVLPA